MKKAPKYLLQNVHCRLGNKIFRKTIGILMGLGPAPSFSNLFLHYHQSRLIQKLKKSNVKCSRRCVNGFQFINDLTAINNGGATEIFYKNI